jgi:pheromone shutdown-related protein TraB
MAASALDSRHVRSLVLGDDPETSKTLHLIGTAHVSRASVDEVARVIREVRPDTVCVELCASRYAALADAERWKKLDIFKVFKEGRALFLLANLAVGAYQRRLGQALGVMPGEELLRGVEVAREVGAEVVLADRDVNITLKRSWGALSIWKKSRLLGAILASLFEGRSDRKDLSLPDGEVPPKHTEDSLESQIEGLKDPTNVSEMMQELARALPQLKRPLIDERDLYLISHLREAPGRVIVGVVGAGHVEGMVKHVDTPVDRAALDALPSPPWWQGLLKWLVPAILVGTFFLGLGKTEGQGLVDMLLAWILPTALCSGVATLLVGGRPVSVMTAALCSPITTIHPLIASGMIVGPVEAWARRPTVADCERIHEDVQSFRGFFRNPFTRTLIVTVAATLGSAIGAWIGLSWVIAIAA